MFIYVYVHLIDFILYFDTIEKALIFGIILIFYILSIVIQNLFGSIVLPQGHILS